MSDTQAASAESAAAPAELPSSLLFVDDEPGILSSLRRLFRPHGYRIFLANGGAEGLDILERETIDLVISDMRMPQMDGAKFLEQVRQKWPLVMRLLLTGYADIASTVAAINRGEVYRYVSKPWDDNDIVLLVRQALQHKKLAEENARLLELTSRQNEELRDLNTGLEQRVAARTAELEQIMAMVERANEDLKKAFFTSVRVFTGLIEMRAGSIGGHSRRVTEHVRAIGQRLGLNESEAQDLTLAALLHDVGKIGLSDALIDKPFNVLTPEQRDEVAKHPVKGQTALMAIDQFRGPALLVRHHHERFDGTGYPDQLAGLAIPLGARILTVANEYDAVQIGTLTARRLTPLEARKFLADNRGKRFDPEVVDAFLSLLGSDAPASDDLTVSSGRLLAGMTLARDLVHHDGYMLLAKGHVLVEANIEHLRRIERTDGHTLTLYIRRSSVAKP